MKFYDRDLTYCFFVLELNSGRVPKLFYEGEVWAAESGGCCGNGYRNMKAQDGEDMIIKLHGYCAMHENPWL